MIRNADSAARITIATSEKQVSQIRSQIGRAVDVSVEPDRKDTFPAIALTVAYLVKNGIDRDEPVVVCPVDPCVGEDYFQCIKEMSDEAGRDGAANLTLMGIEPDYPSEKYGYIIPTSGEHLSPVSGFREKPDAETAERFIACGALWNGGVFAFKASYVLRLAASFLGSSEYQELFDNYGSFRKTSFDYAVVERETSINVIRYRGQWKDLGSWNTFTEGMEVAVTGNIVTNRCDNTHVINELNIPIVALGVNNAVIVATPEGILVSDKKESSNLKEYVSDLRPMLEHRPWGEYRILGYRECGSQQSILTRELVILPERHIGYTMHKK
ncbi:MAG: mannose-1-phosphate guanylyltransferase [Clostridia bacterium]|nr:mannose-1-phosphate guanylyltransferase [Clostridia bacterium]